MAVRPPLRKGDDGSANVYEHRKACPDCGLSHRAVCPSDPTTLPTGFLAPACESCGARDWSADHLDGDPALPVMCPECASSQTGVC